MTNDRYLFKAKTVEYKCGESGKWVIGCLIINESAKDQFRYRIQPVEDSQLFAPPIDPSTICQYTGLTDKNGNKIWENDIVRFDNCSNYPIVWDSDYNAFGSCYYSDFDHLSKYRNIELEVVGNIFDNPELLEGE